MRCVDDGRYHVVGTVFHGSCLGRLSAHVRRLDVDSEIRERLGWTKVRGADGSKHEYLATKDEGELVTPSFKEILMALPYQHHRICLMVA